jgi:prepilin-type N-terminal cleavage/methylation domain-containing protein/prepilin-type processing-associated H-X9-DG protein
MRPGKKEDTMASGNRRGFTLIELLVVIAIISILASILFPVFARAREKGRQAACISNVHQFCMAFQMYAQDYDEIIPAGNFGGTLWHQTIYPYTHNRQIYVCPSRKDCQIGYAVNNLVCGASEGTMFDPAVKILVMDVPPEAIGSTSTSPGTEWWCNSISGIGIPSPLPAGCADGDNTFHHAAQPERHNDGLNVGYGDGHAKWAKESQLNQPYLWVPALETP